jgi:hypothetical protein
MVWDGLVMGLAGALTGFVQTLFPVDYPANTTLPALMAFMHYVTFLNVFLPVTETLQMLALAIAFALALGLVGIGLFVYRLIPFKGT